MLNKLGITNDDGKLSITNIAVYLFIFITAFKTMFSGATIAFSVINWKVESLDLSSTLPLLFSLLNYGHKRSVLSKLLITEEKDKTT